MKYNWQRKLYSVFKMFDIHRETVAPTKLINTSIITVHIYFLLLFFHIYFLKIQYNATMEKEMATHSPGEFHGQRNLMGYSPWGCRESDITEQLTHVLPTRATMLYIRSSELLSLKVCTLRPVRALLLFFIFLLLCIYLFGCAGS